MNESSDTIGARPDASIPTPADGRGSYADFDVTDAIFGCTRRLD
jgi:hypothetical protein